MPPKDTCPVPDLRDTAQFVVDAVEDKNSKAAFQIVNAFWNEHHNDAEWRLFREQMQIDEAMLTLGRKDNDPLVQMFNNFEIILDVKYDSDPPTGSFPPENMDPSNHQDGGGQTGLGDPPGNGHPPHDGGNRVGPDGKGDQPPAGGSDGTQHDGTLPETREDIGKDGQTRFYRDSGPF